MAKLDSYDAQSILAACRINVHVDYHVLSSAQVERLLAHADARRYRKRKDAPRSRARMFHQHLVRLATREGEHL